MAHAILPPLSPLDQFINTPVLTFYAFGVFELESLFNKPEAVLFLQKEFLPLSERFSSVIVTDEKGVQRWSKVEVITEDHVVFPSFPLGLSQEEYDVILEDYISSIHMEQLPRNRPLWEVHLFMYPTSNAAGTMLFKLHHVLGDGYSFISGLLTLFKRADNPSLPLKFPTASSSARLPSLSSFVYKWLNTVTDFCWGVLNRYIEDDNSVLRSKTPMVEYAPVNISSVVFSLDRIRDVKSKIGATVNDVTTGLIAFALQLYMRRKGQTAGGTRSTALILRNMRMFRGFKNVEDMLKANIWGNHFGFLTVNLPSFSDVDNVDPLAYISKSKTEMIRKMNSFGVYFTGKFLNVLGALRGPEAAAEYLHTSLRNTSITISNLVGPVEKASIDGRPVRSFYFSVAGAPQSLVFTIVSYTGELRLIASSERGFIDPKLLNSCLKEAFTKIYVAAVGEHIPGKI